MHHHEFDTQVTQYMYGYSVNCHLALVLETLAIEQWKIIKQHRCKANENNRYIGISTGLLCTLSWQYTTKYLYNAWKIYINLQSDIKIDHPLRTAKVIRNVNSHMQFSQNKPIILVVLHVAHKNKACNHRLLKSSMYVLSARQQYIDKGRYHFMDRCKYLLTDIEKLQFFYYNIILFKSCGL